MQIFCDYCHENRCFTVPVKEASLVHLAHENDFVSNLRVLHGLGYISVNWVKGLRPEYIMVTPEGFAFFEKLSEEKRKFWRESVILPITLAIITTLITNVLSNGA